MDHYAEIHEYVDSVQWRVFEVEQDLKTLEIYNYLPQSTGDADKKRVSISSFATVIAH